jgi:hypothetical protein
LVDSVERMTMHGLANPKKKKKINQLTLYEEIIAVISDIHTEHRNTLCGQNVEILNPKPGGT